MDKRRGAISKPHGNPRGERRDDKGVAVQRSAGGMTSLRMRSQPPTPRQRALRGVVGGPIIPRVTKLPEGCTFEAFYRARFGPTVAVVRPLVGAAAEDVAQEALMVVFRRWSDVSRLELPGAWVRKVALRIAWRWS